MSRKKGMVPHVFGLEARALLSGIDYSLTTDQATYQVGQPIHFTFTATNTSSQPESFWLSPQDFYVTVPGPNPRGSFPPSDQLIWQSDPGNDGHLGHPETLQPGQSISQSATWDGTTPDTVTSSTGATTTYALNHWGSFQVADATSSLVANFQIADPLTVHISTDQSSYQMGQPIGITDAQTNNSDQTILVVPAPLSITHNGSTVLGGSWKNAYAMQPGVVPISIAPGQTITTQQTWDGIPELPPYTLANLTGTFEVDYQSDPYTHSATSDFQITAPASWDIVSSIQTNQAVYHSGQTVPLTFTETNRGEQPVMVVTGPDGFAQPSGMPAFPYWDLHSNWEWTKPAGTQWTTLQPGESLTMTGSWSLPQNMLGPDTEQLTYVFDPNLNIATFQVPFSPIGSGDPSPGSGGSTGVIGDPPIATSTTGGVSNSPIADPSSSPPSSTLPAAVSTGRPDYSLGGPVRISLTIGRRGPAQFVTTARRPLERITISDGNRVVTQLARRIPAIKWKRLEEGRAVTVAKVWSGRANQPGVQVLKPGRYTIDVVAGDYGGSTIVTLGRKRP